MLRAQLTMKNWLAKFQSEVLKISQRLYQDHSCDIYIYTYIHIYVHICCFAGTNKIYWPFEVLKTAVIKKRQASLR